MRAALMMAVGMALLLSGCGRRETMGRAIVARAEALGPEVIGPADAFRAEMLGLHRGGADRVTLTGVRVRPDETQLFDPVQVTLEGVQVSRKPWRVTQTARTQFSLQVSAAAVNRHLREVGRGRAGTVRDLQVEFSPGEVAVNALVSFAGVDVPVETSGKVEIEDGIRVVYKPEKLRVVGLGIPALVVHKVVGERANPLVDLSGLRFTPRIDHVGIEAGGLALSGNAILRTRIE